MIEKIKVPSRIEGFSKLNKQKESVKINRLSKKQSNSLNPTSSRIWIQPGDSLRAKILKVSLYIATLGILPISVFVYEKNFYSSSEKAPSLQGRVSRWQGGPKIVKKEEKVDLQSIKISTEDIKKMKLEERKALYDALYTQDCACFNQKNPKEKRIILRNLMAKPIENDFVRGKITAKQKQGALAIIENLVEGKNQEKTLNSQYKQRVRDRNDFDKKPLQVQIKLIKQLQQNLKSI
jgi:hypothetical protein